MRQDMFQRGSDPDPEEFNTLAVVATIREQRETFGSDWPIICGISTELIKDFDGADAPEIQWTPEMLWNASRLAQSLMEMDFPGEKR